MLDQLGARYPEARRSRRRAIIRSLCPVRARLQEPTLRFRSECISRSEDRSGLGGASDGRPLRQGGQVIGHEFAGTSRYAVNGSTAAEAHSEQTCKRRCTGRPVITTGQTTVRELGVYRIPSNTELFPDNR